MALTVSSNWSLQKGMDLFEFREFLCRNPSASNLSFAFPEDVELTPDMVAAVCVVGESPDGSIEVHEETFDFLQLFLHELYDGQIGRCTRTWVFHFSLPPSLPPALPSSLRLPLLFSFLRPFFPSTLPPLSISSFLSHSFNDHFLGGPGLAGIIVFPFWILLELRMTEMVITAGSINRAKLQSNCHHQQTNTRLFTGRMPFLSANQQCQSTEGRGCYHFCNYRNWQPRIHPHSSPVTMNFDLVDPVLQLSNQGFSGLSSAMTRAGLTSISMVRTSLGWQEAPTAPQPKN